MRHYFKEDWDIKFAALLLCEHKDDIGEYTDCTNVVLIHCLNCQCYFCMEHFSSHLCNPESTIEIDK